MSQWQRQKSSWFAESQGGALCRRAHVPPDLFGPDIQALLNVSGLQREEEKQGICKFLLSIISR